MISSSDKQLLEETYKNSKRGVESISTLLNKVYDTDLNYEMNNQLQKYREINSKASDMLIESGVMLENKPIDKMKMWSAIQLNTIFNTSTEHIADMMIQGSAMGATNIMTTLKDTGKNAAKESCELANELLAFEEDNIYKLKSYL